MFEDLRVSRLSWLPPWTVAVLAVSSFHMLEHVLQTYQAYVLGWPHAHGLLGQYVDTDWMHLAFNSAFFLALLPVVRQGGDPRSLRWQLFVGGVAAAGYHVVEHSVKTYQAVGLEHDPALGLVGTLGPLIPLHLWINAVVFTLVTPHLIGWARRWQRSDRLASSAPHPARAP